MPEEGITLTPNSHLLTSDEIIKIASIFVSEGVKKGISTLSAFLLRLIDCKTLESTLQKYF